MQLMQEGVQKTASYCASICAERVVSARREMQRRWAEERRELERIYGLAPGSGAGSGFGTPSSARMNHVPRAAASRAGSCNSWSTPCQELPTSSPQNEGAAPRVQALSSSKVENDSGQQNLDSSFIDAYDAVQTLEERNHQAARAMQLLDEVVATILTQVPWKDQVKAGMMCHRARWTRSDRRWRTSPLCHTGHHRPPGLSMELGKDTKAHCAQTQPWPPSFQRRRQRLRAQLHQGLVVAVATALRENCGSPARWSGGRSKVLLPMSKKEKGLQGQCHRPTDQLWRDPTIRSRVEV